jgi:hypothetical protein
VTTLKPSSHVFKLSGNSLWDASILIFQDTAMDQLRIELASGMIFYTHLTLSWGSQVLHQCAKLKNGRSVSFRASSACCNISLFFDISSVSFSCHLLLPRKKRETPFVYTGQQSELQAVSWSRLRSADFQRPRAPSRSSSPN